MAVSKLWPVTVRLATVLDYASNPEKTTKSKSKYSDADYQALRDVVAYAKDGEKTERELFCEGIHCNPQTAREQFITVKEQFDKPDGIQAYHGYLSFEETDITPELAQQVGMAFAERMWGDRFQVLVTTHLNTEHLHCHFVVNSVSFRDGKRLQNKEKAWWYFRHIADEVCLEHGLSVVQNPEAYQSPRILTQKDKAGMPTRYNLARAALDEAIAMSHNLRQLEYHLSEMGYTLGSNPKRKYWTIKGKGDERPIRLHRLGEEYTKERITQRLIENRDNIDFEPFQPKTYRPKQYRLRTRSDRIGKVGGLYGLYLYIKRDIGNSVALCQCVAQELGHAQLAMNCEAYSRRDMGFSAVCVGYMLCRKFGVDVKNFAIDRIPEELAGKSPKEIRAELSKTRSAMSEIGSRVSEEIYRRRADRSKDQER